MRVILLFSWVLGQDIYLVFEIHLPHFITLSIAFTTFVICCSDTAGHSNEVDSSDSSQKLQRSDWVSSILFAWLWQGLWRISTPVSHTISGLSNSMTFLSPKDVLFDRLRPPASLLTSLLFPVPNKYFNVQTISTSLTSMIIESSLSKKLQDLRQKCFTISYTITFISGVCCSNESSWGVGVEHICLIFFNLILTLF